MQQRLRDLPSRVGVYFLLALGLFPKVGYARVWDMLVAGLEGMMVAAPSEKALRDMRRRLGAAPLKLLFDSLAVPLAPPRTPGVCYRGWRTVAFDGCGSLKTPDSPRNRGWLGRAVTGRGGWIGYPALELLTLVETGTRGLLAAVFGPKATGEITYASRLVTTLDPTMLLLADRAFDGAEFMAQVHATGAAFCIRLRSNRRMPILARLSDGSFLTRVGALNIRVVQAAITVSLADGTVLTSHYSLATTLLDHRAHPASVLTGLYHERWEIESSYFALRHTLLDGRVLRSCDPVGIEQELWALLALYQALRVAMVDAVKSRPDTDPDRASFTIALTTAQAQLIKAQGIVDHEPDPSIGAIGAAILANLLPPRRPRLSTRKVKAPVSRYGTLTENARPLASTKILTIAVDIDEPGSPPPPELTNQQRTRVMTPGSRINRAFHLMKTDTDKSWSPSELARHLKITNINSFSVQLADWSRRGLIIRKGRGAYTIPPQPSQNTALDRG